MRLSNSILWVLKLRFATIFFQFFRSFLSKIFKNSKFYPCYIFQHERWRDSRRSKPALCTSAKFIVWKQKPSGKQKNKTFHHLKEWNDWSSCGLRLSVPYLLDRNTIVKQLKTNKKFLQNYLVSDKQALYCNNNCTRN